MSSDETTYELIEERLVDAGLEPEDFDVADMVFDFNNGNLNLNTDELEVYDKFNIVRCSIVNGQFKQAKSQCERYHIDFENTYLSVTGSNFGGI